MDLSIYQDDFTQHDLFGLFPGAPGGRALRDIYGHIYLVTIASTGGRATLERYGKAKRYKEDTQPRTLPIGMARPSATSRIVHPAAGVAGHASSASF